MTLKTTFQGKLDLTLAEDNLEALMQFTPSEETLEIDMAFLSRLLQMKNVRDGILTRELERLLVKGKHEREAFSLCVARGTPAADPVAENALWEKLSIPEELQEVSKKAFAAAGKPAIYVEKTENIKHEKIVLKKSPIPFAPPRKEKVVEIEKKVTKIHVTVDPEIVAAGYVAEGALIAQLEPSTPGSREKTFWARLFPRRPWKTFPCTRGRVF